MSASDSPFPAVADDLDTVLLEALPRLSALDDAKSLVPRAPGAWTPRESLGHLVDSAVNNHQRFVRAQVDPSLAFPGYEQEGWVAVQGYRERPFSEIVHLWHALNVHLCHVIRRLPAEAASLRCTIGGDAPVTLEFVARDYVRHLRHHLGQVLTG